MTKFIARTTLKVMTAKARLMSRMKEERGEVNLVAILLIIVVVVGLVVIFKDNIEALIGNIFSKITGDVETNFGTAGEET